MNSKYNIPLFEDTTDDELDWLIANSSELVLEKGEFFAREGEPPKAFYIVLEGELHVTRTVNGQPMVMGTTPRGVIGNELPILNGTTCPATARAIMRCVLMTFDIKTFRAIFGACPTVGSKILKIAAERTVNIAGMLKQQEKMAALGKLSAGLAHELNNPAAAARRAADTLRETLPDLQRRTLALCDLELPEQELDKLDAFQRQMVERASSAKPLSTLEQSDREEQIGDWLDQAGVAESWELAGTFATAQLTPAELAALAEPIAPAQRGVMLSWLASAISAAGLLDEVMNSTRRISDLVGAIKSYTYMDQAGGLQEVDVHKGLENTLAILAHKLKNITLVRTYDPELPHILARGSELNQVWTNLIDNAIDAMHGSGSLQVITRCEHNFVMVEFTDNGPGIPPDVLPRIFDPFFTTKSFGFGTGLGLDITYRIVQQHNGTIEVHSKPGQTRFIVRLPLGTNT